MVGLWVHGQSIQHLEVAIPGGMPGSNLITAVVAVSNGVQVSWDGPSGYCQLFASPTLTHPHWRALGQRTNLVRRATVPEAYSDSFFKVLGPLGIYGSSRACVSCHSPIENSIAKTAHTAAFTNEDFVACGGNTNKSCFACHSVGYGIKTGFISKAKTPRLAGVQCENCHGPAEIHAANPDDPASRPRIEIASEVCGGCHTGPSSPTFEEWTNSAHAGVAKDFNSAAEISACGRCHSGSVRLSLLEGTQLPKGDADVGIVCATCHDPHQETGNFAQLRNPVASTNDYYMPATGSFAANYNPQINICAQCHNHAGASWTNSASEPHHSLQYNVLLGTIGELESGAAPYMPGTHALSISNQCAGCHMQTTSYSEGQAAVTGHSFSVQSYEVCAQCHGLSESMMAANVAFATGVVSNQIQQIKGELDNWALTKAPAQLTAKYGALAWEYSTPGALSTNGPGPDALEQELIPTNIQKARFNLYVAHNDGSYGIHNVDFTEALLIAADDWIEEEMMR